MFIAFSSLIGACNETSENESNISESEYQTVSSTKAKTSSYFETDRFGKSDGVIEPLDEKELIIKLSQLEAEMSLDEVISIFGKDPFYVMETGVNMFVYYSGDITIRLWGTSLYMVAVECNGSKIHIELGKNFDIPRL